MTCFSHEHSDETVIMLAKSKVIIRPQICILVWVLRHCFCDNDTACNKRKVMGQIGSPDSPDRSGQTVKIQIRLLPKEQSDQGLYCLPSHLHYLDTLRYNKQMFPVRLLF